MKSRGASDPGDTNSKTAELEVTIRQMERAVAELERDIEAEEVKTKIHDFNDPGYSTIARSARERRDKLCTSVRRLKMELAIARAEKLRMPRLPSPLRAAPIDF